MAFALEQVTAFEEGVEKVIADSGLATACFDLQEPVQEAVLFSPGVVSGLMSVMSNNKLVERQAQIDVCKKMLSAMSALLKVVGVLHEHGFSLKGVDEYRLAMRSLRFVLADALDGDANTVGSSHADTDRFAVTSFEKLANELPPSDSWYDEDARQVRGPSFGGD